MLLRKAAGNADRITTLGLIALALANVSSYLIQRKTGLPESVADGFSGFAYGVAIAITLLGLVARARSRRGDHRHG